MATENRPDDSSAAKRRVLRSIARVGSIDFQERECVQGTRENYVLLDELIDTAIGRAKRAAISRLWTQNERDALLAFARRASELFRHVPWDDPGVTLEQIVRNDRSLGGIRDAAQECLRQLDVEFSLDELLQD